MANEVECLIFDGMLPTFLCWALFDRADLLHDMLPGSSG